MTATPRAQIAQPTPPSSAARATNPRPIIALLLIAAFVMILNETIMGVALPHLMRDFAIDAGTAQWLATGFMLTMAVVIPTSGFLLNRFPLRGLAITAIAVFTAGTLLAALAPSFAVLLMARVLQAVGTAIMTPLLSTTILNVVSAEKRGRTMGGIAIVMAAAPAIGPTVSGLILNNLSWRWMFWFVFPVAAATLIAAIFTMRNLTERRPASLDILSTVLSALGFAGLIYGISSLGEEATGHAGVSPLVPLGVGVISLGLFIWRQLVLQRTDSALLDLRTFTNRSFTIAVILVFFSMLALFGALIVLPLFVQNVLGLTALQTGLMMLPGGLIMGIFAPVSGALSDRFGPRWIVLFGTVVSSLALWLFSGTVGAGTESWHIVLLLMLLNAGLGFTLTPLLSSALGSLRPSLYAHGSATVNTLQQVAGATGTALFITLMTNETTRHLTSGENPLLAGAAGAHAAFTGGAILSLLAIVLALFIRNPHKEEAQ
ncbi:DHA2 family efflux MFS transporter permease subunit [Mycetocola sp. JXN-3]|uniref:DHA2 family efflux MFS transporter permease subunit n=1 Tax=Mycetocola sp. JXN-3 TaxID=2116510 RepID=UPI00165CF0F2|nr:DHA2 family efflux MFS transporter permease subunit [Mycetocola sp. JXN-3]